MQKTGNPFTDKRSLIVLFIVAAHVTLDRLTKSWIRTFPLNSEIGQVGFIRIINIRNPGSAFGLFQGQSVPLMFIASAGVIMLLAALFWVHRKLPQYITVWNLVAYSLILGGTIGNLLDRITEGGMVTDFIDPGFWPAFNAADSGISIGGVMLVISILRAAWKESAEQKKSQGGSNDAKAS